jgi:hypothetical protein
VPVTTARRVTIEFEDPIAGGRSREIVPFEESHVRIVQLLRAAQGRFALHGRGKPAWDLPSGPDGEWTGVLDTAESERLLGLLDQLRFAHSPPQPPGFDGAWFTLEVLAGAHSLHLQWWGQVPRGWESAGTVYDYAVSLARRVYLASLAGAA